MVKNKVFRVEMWSNDLVFNPAILTYGNKEEAIKKYLEWKKENKLKADIKIYEVLDITPEIASVLYD